MKLVILVKGKKLDVEHFWECEKIAVKGYIDLIIFINQELFRHLKHVDGKCIIEFFGKDLELVTKTKDMITISGDVVKFFTYDKHGRLGQIVYINPSDFK